MDAPPSTPPSPSPSRARAPLGISPPDSISPGPPPHCHETSSASKSKRRAIGIHIKSFFESTRPTLWTLANFTSHCHSFAGKDDAYVWANDKVYSFYIDHLNKLLLERSPLATEAKIRQLLQRAQPRRNTRLRKRGSEKEKPQAGTQDSSRLNLLLVYSPNTDSPSRDRRSKRLQEEASS
ncbi:hypothetical protein BGX38DRAFT_927347 [Terfezia claveryi]|nr:hypothetical protein BGX38DRAFT_927347 [Terfezia claveryi]